MGEVALLSSQLFSGYISFSSNIPAKKASVISFIVDGAHPFDIGTILDQMGIAIRTGHHCTQPLMDFYKISGTARASFAFYNTKEEVDYFIKSLEKAIRMLN